MKRTDGLPTDHWPTLILSLKRIPLISWSPNNHDLRRFHQTAAVVCVCRCHAGKVGAHLWKIWIHYPGYKRIAGRNCQDKNPRMTLKGSWSSLRNSRNTKPGLLWCASLLTTSHRISTTGWMKISHPTKASFILTLQRISVSLRGPPQADRSNQPFLPNFCPSSWPLSGCSSWNPSPKNIFASINPIQTKGWPILSTIMLTCLGLKELPSRGPRSRFSRLIYRRRVFGETR